MNIKRLPNRDFNNMLEIELGSKIKKAREECGLSQTELANLMNYKTSVPVHYWEVNERMISAVDLWKVSQITKLPITFFI